MAHKAFIKPPTLLGSVFALNASTGVELWSYTTGAVLYSSPAVAGGVVYVGSQASYPSDTIGSVSALNASTGVELWGYTMGASELSGGYSSPAVVGGVVYVGSGDGNIYALNASTGDKLWSYLTASFVVLLLPLLAV